MTGVRHAGSTDALRRRSTYRSRLAHADSFLARRIGAFVARRLTDLLRAGQRVADVGCGEQPFRPLIEERGARYVGIDLRENRGGSVEILAGVGSLPLPAGELDVVLCTEVLDHVADLDGALREMGRTLKAGGSIVLTIPFCYPLHEEPEDYARWTPYRLRAAASACGLLVSDLTLFGNELEVIATVWANVWCRSRAAGRWPAVDRFVLPLLYVPFHLLCWAGSVGFGRRLPGKIFLGFGATLTRGSGPPGPA